MDILEAQALDKEHETLEGFYASVRERASGITDPKGRQKIIVELYDKFFKTASPRMVERLGIVYTPVEIVDFILHSADAALQAHFGARLADQNVHILDPFTGTGTFPVRLIETGLIPPEKLPYKYRHELHANEIVLLAYYIAAINIEEAFHRVTGQEYEPFPGIVLTDTFQMNEPQTGDLDEGLPENHKRADEQKARDIRVIVGNPPYSVGQDNANDNNQNLKYPKLDGRIAATYAAHSTATNKNSLYDSYIRAFRWASDRIKDEGIVCFVTNGGWIDGNTMDGFRKTLQDEFADVYVFNLRGNARTQGEQRRKEAGNVFDSGSRTPVAITMLIKRKNHQGKAAIHYHDIGDYLSREQKLEIVSSFGSYQQVPWQTLEPNEHHDWINQRSGDFNAFVPLNDGDNSIFALRSNGIKTQRDAWVYNASAQSLEDNVRRHLDYYNAERERISPMLADAASQKERETRAAKLVVYAERKGKWTAGLIQDAARNRACQFDADNVGVALYRPFYKTNFYYERLLNERRYQIPSIFPKHGYDNLVVQVTGAGESKDFSCLISNVIPNLHTISGGQCFPLHWYEKVTDTNPQGGFGFDGQEAGTPDANGYIKRDGITDVALANFRQHYSDESVTKEDIFYYVYMIWLTTASRKCALPRLAAETRTRASSSSTAALPCAVSRCKPTTMWSTARAPSSGSWNAIRYRPTRTAASRMIPMTGAASTTTRPTSSISSSVLFG
ncbi:hypothetical protein FEP54_06017 [Burkholderia multivorans]|nr:hypothetical protein [Burkholderia multivorans]MDR8927259.1 hypothetical protein [Burkholderia multivorans]MDR8969473.1 hypothetical protein [Burkholderia multivorans]MDR8993838.1 hypothetical protein [Burkholderia multivorans]MDR9024622.1 hypothetical protein [Burkholderia multivorans]